MSKEKIAGLVVSYTANNSAINNFHSNVSQSSMTTTLGGSTIDNYVWNGIAQSAVTYPAVLTTFGGTDISKSVIGWDKQLDSLEKIGELVLKNSGTFPPYNVFQEDENTILIELAVAGFSKEDIKIKQQKNALTIEGSIEEDKDKVYTYKGIATRSFTKAFALGEYYEVDSAKFKDGILTIRLVREFPEEEKPRQIAIK